MASWLTTLVLLTVASSVAANGLLCGDRKCLETATCENNECVCNESTPVGKGDFACYARDKHFCEVDCDPAIRTFSLERTLLHDVCRYAIAHATTLSNFSNGKCETWVYVWHMKYNGKIYVAGFEIYIVIKTGDKHILILCFKVQARISDSTVTYTPSYKFSLNPQEPSISGYPDITLDDGQRLNPGLDSDGFVRFSVDQCGFSLGFRGLDPSNRRSVIPGIWFAVNKENDPVFYGGICLAPPETGITIASVAAKLQIQEEDALWLKIMTSGTIQRPDAPPTLANLTDNLLYCDPQPRAEALRIGRFMMASPLFVKCYDLTDNGNEIVILFNKFVEAMCDRDRDLCLEAQEDVRKSPCEDRADEEFVNFPCFA